MHKPAMLLITAALGLGAASLPAGAGTASASFQASLTIVGSCAVSASHHRPLVACSHASAAYRIDRAPLARTGATIWTVTF